MFANALYHIQVKCWAKYTIHDAHKANAIIDTWKQKRILADGECCPPLSEEALKKHDLETSCELRQFRCPNCYVFWWKTVPKYKPVSTCFRCQLCLNPLGYLQQFGTGRFTCQCNNVFFGKCQGSDSRVCTECGRSVDKPYIHPHFKMDDCYRLPNAHEQQIHSTTARAATASLGHYYVPATFVSDVHNSSNYTSGDLPHPRCRVRLRDFWPLAHFPVLNSHSPLVRNPIANPIPSQATGVFPSDRPASTSLEASSIAMEGQNASLSPPDNPPTCGNFMGLDNEIIPTINANSSAVFQPQALSTSSRQVTNSPGDCSPFQQQSMVTSSVDGKCVLDSASGMILASNGLSDDTSVDYNPPLTSSISSLAIDFPNSEGNISNSLLDNAQPSSEGLSKVVPLPSHTDTNPNISSQDQTSPKNDVKGNPDVSTAISLPTTNTIIGPVSMSISSDQLCMTPNYIPPLTTAIPSSATNPPALCEHTQETSSLHASTQPALTDALANLNHSESSSKSTFANHMPEGILTEHETSSGCKFPTDQDSTLVIDTLPHASDDSSTIGSLDSSLPQANNELPTPPRVVSAPFLDSCVAVATPVSPPLTDIEIIANQISPLSVTTCATVTQPLTGVNSSPTSGSLSSVDVLINPLQTGVDEPPVGTLVSPPKTDLNSSPSLSAHVDPLALEQQTNFDSTLKRSSSQVVTDTVVITAPHPPIDSTPIQNSSPADDTLAHASYPGTCDTLIDPPKTETVINTSQSNLQVSLNTATTTTVSLPQTKTNPTPQSQHPVLNISVNVNTTINTASAPMASAEHNVPTGRASQGASRKTKIYRDPRNLKYKQVSTLHHCTGSTESTIVPQLDDRLSHSKFKPHHHAYRRQMPTFDFDCQQDNSTTEEESEEEDQ